MKENRRAYSKTRGGRKGRSRESRNLHRRVLSPLARKTVLITRTAAGNVIERRKLESKGARVVSLDCIRVESSFESKQIQKIAQSISTYQWIVFTSANGVKVFFEALGKVLLAMKNKTNVSFACVGPSTSRELSRMGLRANLVPKEFLTRSLAQELSERFDLEGKHVLLARTEGTSGEMTSILNRAGAIVTQVAFYRTIPTKVEGAGASLLRGVTDITLTSPSTVDGLLMNLSQKEIATSRSKINCIGPVTAKRARQRGLRVTCVAKVHTLDGLIQALVSDVCRIKKAGKCKKEN